MLDEIIKELTKKYNDLIYEALQKYCGITKDNILEYKDRIMIWAYPNGDKKYYLDGEEVFTVRNLIEKDGKVFVTEVVPTLR